jgi:hypothetical protein
MKKIVAEPLTPDRSEMMTETTRDTMVLQVRGGTEMTIQHCKKTFLSQNLNDRKGVKSHPGM